MNKGYFFKLNQHLSAVENGIAIFDYTELPDYNSPELDNANTAKYPISVAITSDAVCFKLHYCTYHHNYTDDNNKSISYHRHIDTSFHNEDKWGLTHVEDVILELPFAANATSRLSDIIRKSYNTEFPQKYSEELQGYLETLIRKKYIIKNENRKPQKPSSDYYCTQWLMDVYDDYGEVNIYENNNQEGKITKFLRKLILDFMFDLKHSNVFQSSSDFQRMFTGLMSDFYFSSLMHKCEFYYYRDLVTRQVKLVAYDTTDSFTYLYAKELFDAQELWTNDIMNPLSESFFEHDYPDWKVSFFSLFLEKLNAKKWNSWFATPEEEMRRVYFTMNEWGNKSINCNAETVSEYLDLNKSEDNVIKASLVLMRENREKISRWFLSRYDFNDVFHLHFFIHFNPVFLILSILFLSVLFLNQQCALKIAHNAISLIMANSSLWLIFMACSWATIWLMRWYFSQRMEDTEKGDDTLRISHNRLYTVKLLKIAIILCAFTFVIVEFVKKRNSITWQIYENHLGIAVSLVIILFLLILLEPEHLLIQSLSFVKRQTRRLVRNMHILLPKLIASITAAWLTLSTGYVIYASFYTIKVTKLVPIAITVIVVCFIISRISRTMPTASYLLITIRAVELLIISYFISLVIGIIAINFVGEKYMYHNADFKEALKTETRNGIRDSTQWKTTSDDNIYDIIYSPTERKIRSIVSERDSISIHLYAKSPESDEGEGRLIALNYEIRNTDHDLFIMPDFLIMFSFITMFIGIFLQMAFFDNRQMTDF